MVNLKNRIFVLFKGNLLKSQTGFTLTELMITVIFIGVAMVGILNTYNVGLRSASDSESISIAAQIAEKKMEMIKSDKAAFGYSYIISNNYPQEENPDNYSGYTRRVIITTFANYKKTKVVVSHDKFPDVSLVTIFTNY